MTADRNGGAFLWEADAGREVGTLRGHKGAVTSASWRSDSKVVATSGVDGNVRFWDREEGKQIKNWTAHGGGTESVRFAADGRLVTAGRDRTVKLWKPDGGHIKDLASFGDIVLAASIDHAGKRVVAGNYTGEVRLFDVESGQVVGTPAPTPPTLAMRVATAIQHTEGMKTSLDSAMAARQEADKVMAAAEAKAGRRAAVLADMQTKLDVAQASRDAAAVEAEAKKQQIDFAEENVNGATSSLAAASAEIQSAEAARKQAREKGEDLAAAETSFAAATEKAKQAIADVEAAHVARKAADQAHADATSRTNQAKTEIETAQKARRTAQSAVDEFAGPMAAAQEAVTAKTNEVSTQQELVRAASEGVDSANAEMAAFGAALTRLTAAIGKSDSMAGEAASALTAATTAEQQAAADLAVRKAATDEAAAKLAVAKAEFEERSKAMNDARKTRKQKGQAADEAALAHTHAEATAAQARADKEMFEKASDLRKKYSK